jgi:glycine/D-amino acid oxidase-like deaminating enzyme
MKTNYLLIGQGLAGSLLAHFLEQAGQRVFVIGQQNERAASSVAAGLINPITGRRFVKSWQVDCLIPFARTAYRALEQELGIPIFHERNILRALGSPQEENDWLARSADPAFEAYILGQADLSRYAGRIHPVFGYGEVRHSAQVEIGALVAAYRQYLEGKDAYREEAFDYQQLQLGAEGVVYQDITADTLVFCEGRWAKGNPFFSYLPFHGDKGEVLIVRIPEAGFEKILKQGIFIVPLSDGRYWVGSNYVKSPADDAPTAAGESFLRSALEDILQLPFEVLEHRAAIRPTVKDRRPFLGRHPQYSRLAIFNGLGTKGASLGPYWAHHLAAHLTAGAALDAAVDIGRFGTAVEVL